MIAAVVVLAALLGAALAVVLLQRRTINRLRAIRDVERISLKRLQDRYLKAVARRPRPTLLALSPYAPLFTEGAPDECYECETTGQNCFAHRKDGA